MASLALQDAGGVRAQGAPGALNTFEDYSPGDDWNSISVLLDRARQAGHRPRVVQELDLGDLRPADALLILNPQAPPPERELVRFLQAGGRVALADDNGRGTDLLSIFHIRRSSPRRRGALMIRSNPNLLVARPRERHPLSRGVEALVTNHPTSLRHRELTPVFEFSPGELQPDPLVLAGAVGDGRLVAIGDPSIFINNMQEFSDNRRFADNLLVYLQSPGTAGRLYVVPPGALMVGRYGEPGADRPLHDLRLSLERLAGLQLPPQALQVITFALVVITLLLTLWILPLRSGLERQRLWPEIRHLGGFAGRIALFGGGERRHDLRLPLEVYKLEFRTHLERLVYGQPGGLAADTLPSLGRLGAPKQMLGALQNFLGRLDRATGAGSTNPLRTALRAADLIILVEEGERLLSEVGTFRETTMHPPEEENRTR